MSAVPVMAMVSRVTSLLSVERVGVLEMSEEEDIEQAVIVNKADIKINVRI